MSAKNQPVIVIGPYTAGELPIPIVVTFKDASGFPLDLSAYTTARWVIQQRATAPVTRNAVILAQNVAANLGKVQYVWVAADFAFDDDYEGEMWIGNGGTLRLASVRYAWTTWKSLVVPAPPI